MERPPSTPSSHLNPHSHPESYLEFWLGGGGGGGKVRFADKNLKLLTKVKIFRVEYGKQLGEFGHKFSSPPYIIPTPAKDAICHNFAKLVRLQLIAYG